MADSMPKKLTRTQIMQRKKRINELLRSAYSSDKDHLSDFPNFRHYNTTGLSLFLESGRGDKLSSNLKQYIQKLLKVNMEGPYGAEWPAEEKVKRREMSSPEALYIFVHKAPSASDHMEASVIGFVQYRFTIEEEIPVLYVYELQLEPTYQGRGIGKFLMQLVELIACRNCMGAVVLTVQKRNSSAINFYLNKLRYNISSISPSKVYKLFGIIGEEKSYEILCKTFDHEAKAVLEGRPKARTLKTSPLPFPDLCIALFEGTSATGSRAHAATSSRERSQVASSSSHFELFEDDEAQAETSNEPNMQEPSTAPPEVGRPTKKSKSATNYQEELARDISSALKVFVSQPQQPPQQPPQQDPLDACIDRLETLGMAPSDPLYRAAFDIFGSSVLLQKTWLKMPSDPVELKDWILRNGRRLGFIE